MANAQLGSDALADLGFWGMVDGVLGEVELAALPGGAAEHPPPLVRAEPRPQDAG